MRHHNSNRRRTKMGRATEDAWRDIPHVMVKALHARQLKANRKN
jgi:hypothetical protein